MLLNWRFGATFDALPRFGHETHLAMLALLGAVAYGGILLAGARVARLSLRR